MWRQYLGMCLVGPGLVQLRGSRSVRLAIKHNHKSLLWRLWRSLSQRPRKTCQHYCGLQKPPGSADDVLIAFMMHSVYSCAHCIPLNRIYCITSSGHLADRSFMSHSVRSTSMTPLSRQFSFGNSQERSLLPTPIVVTL